MPQWDSIPQFKQASAHRQTSYNTWPLGSAMGFIPLIFVFDFTGNFETQSKGTQFLRYAAFTCGMAL
jgi:hypothetical protein